MEPSKENETLTLLKKELTMYIKLAERLKIPQHYREKQINLYLEDIQRELKKQKIGE